MGDLISRSAFIKETCGACDGYCDNCGCDCLTCDSPSRCDFVRALSAAPAVDAVEVVHGRWQSGYVCSVCEHDLSSWADAYYETPYCPNCGAKMDGERKDNEFQQEN